jgi:sugar phosphate isomerase/epimerase
MRAPFRLGTTSYVLPDTLVANVRFLADKVRDIELLLFEIDDVENLLPEPAVLHELQALASAHDLTYTVHLPLALNLGEGGPEAEAALSRSERVVEAMSVLHPFAYIAHLGQAPATGVEEWIERAVSSLARLGVLAGGTDRIAVENPGKAHPGMAAVVGRSLASRCVDVGHLWRAGQDPLPELAESQAALRVMHLHGNSHRDHQSLTHLPPGELRRVLRWLHKNAFGGVVTLEIFDLADFWSSHHAVVEALEEGWEEA